MGEYTMTKEEISALDRRNTDAHKFVMAELKEIKRISKGNEQVLINVNSHLSVINGTIGDHKTNFSDLNELLRGKGKNDAGLVGEHVFLMDFAKEQKKNIDRLRWWFFTLVGGLVVTGILTASLTNILG